MLTFRRYLRLKRPFMRGQDVLELQQFLGITADGVHGPKTDTEVRRFQADYDLVVDGIVGPATIAKANEIAAKDEPEEERTSFTIELTEPQDLVAAFRQAKNYRWARRKPDDILWIVLHTAEIAESEQGAEALMNVCATHDRMASWHFATDNNTITQSVREEHVAFAAPGANRAGIQIEMSGRARQTAEDWDDQYSRDMLELTAELVASLCYKWQVPIRFRDFNELRARKPGITTHAEVTEAWRRTDHTDPGKNFPLDAFLAKVRSHAGVS